MVLSYVFLFLYKEISWKQIYQKERRMEHYCYNYRQIFYNKFFIFFVKMIK